MAEFRASALEMQAHRLDRIREDGGPLTLTDRANLREAAEMLKAANRSIEMLRRALCWHGDLQRMATTREEWQQEIDAAIIWVKANPEPEQPSFPTFRFHSTNLGEPYAPER